MANIVGVVRKGSPEQARIDAKIKERSKTPADIYTEPVETMVRDAIAETINTDIKITIQFHFDKESDTGKWHKIDDRMARVSPQRGLSASRVLPIEKSALMGFAGSALFTVREALTMGFQKMPDLGASSFEVDFYFAKCELYAQRIQFNFRFKVKGQSWSNNGNQPKIC